MGSVLNLQNALPKCVVEQHISQPVFKSPSKLCRNLGICNTVGHVLDFLRQLKEPSEVAKCDFVAKFANSMFIGAYAVIPFEIMILSDPDRRCSLVSDYKELYGAKDVWQVGIGEHAPVYVMYDFQDKQLYSVTIEPRRYLIEIPQCCCGSSETSTS